MRRESRKAIAATVFAHAADLAVGVHDPPYEWPPSGELLCKMDRRAFRQPDAHEENATSRVGESLEREVRVIRQMSRGVASGQRAIRRPRYRWMLTANGVRVSEQCRRNLSHLVNVQT